MQERFVKQAAVCIAALIIVQPVFGQAQANWSGQAQCQVSLQSQGYVHQEIQTWTLAGGAPTQQGAMQVYPATWSVTGQGGAQRAQGTQVMAAQWNSSVPGVSAPIAIFVRASDGRLIIKPWHSQLSVFNAIGSVRQVGSSQTNATYTAYEWPFPAIDDVASSANVSGTGTVQVSGNSMPVPSADRNGVAACKWQFIKGGSGPQQYVNASTQVARTPVAVSSGIVNANSRNFGGAAAGAAAPAANGTNPAGGAPATGNLENVSGSGGAAAPGAAGAGTTNALAGGAPGGNSTNNAGAAASAAAGSASGASGGAGGASSNTTTDAATQSPAVSTLQGSLQTHPVLSSATLASTTPLAAPTGFTAQSVGNGSVRLTWQPVAGASKYQIQGTGIAASGVYVNSSAPTFSTTSRQIALHEPPGTTIQNVPLGLGDWQIAAVDLHNVPSSQTSTAKAVVRYVPPHSTPWLTKNNGAGSVALAIAHYTSACPVCAPGVTFGTVATALGLPQSMIQHNCANANGYYSCTPALIAHDDYGDQWNPEAVYSNITEFGTTRTALCWNVSIPPGSPGLPPRVLCYSNSGDHGLTVISKDMQYAWFMTFASPGPNASVFDYKLTTDVTFDSEGPKHAPHACLSCHGGQWNANGARVTGATLLPLDPGMVQVTDQSKFMGLNFVGVNQAVVSSMPSPAVARYLTGLYGKDPRQVARQMTLDDGSLAWQNVSSTPYTGNPWPSMDFVPAGWAQQVDLYKNAIKPHCMMCHLATPTNLDFSTYGSFAQNKTVIYSAVCTSHTMPHSTYPFKQFWTKDTGQVFVPGWLVGSLGYTSCP